MTTTAHGAVLQDMPSIISLKIRKKQMHACTLILILGTLSCALPYSNASSPQPFHEDFESGDARKTLLSGKMTYHVQSPKRVDVVTSPVRSGRYALKLTVHPYDRAPQKNGKNRAEAKPNYDFTENEEGWYRWSFYIPKDFKDLPKKSKAFTMIAQWKQNGKNKKEKVPPCLNVRYGVINKQPGISVLYGLGKNKKTIGILPIEKGQWIDMVAHIRWSKKETTGFAEIFANGKALTPYNKKEKNYRVYQANTYNDQSIIFKVGLYRGQAGEAKTVNSIYIDSIRIGNSPQEIEYTVPQRS